MSPPFTAPIHPYIPPTSHLIVELTHYTDPKLNIAPTICTRETRLQLYTRVYPSFLVLSYSP